jgi:uncharacterized protein (DUF2236 family)
VRDTAILDTPREAEALAPEAVVRRVHAEGLILVGGGRALLMQVAHPLVARGVAEHSTYARDRPGRLLRTLRPMYAIAFGTPDEAAAAVHGVRAVHGRVAGSGYRADDPALLAWVLATLIDTTLLMHERFIAPLPRGEAEAYYAGMTAVGTRLGMPRAALPGTLTMFEAYVAETVAALRVGEEARDIAGALFAPIPGAPWLTLALPVARALTAGLLPPTLREEYGLQWGPGREAVLRSAARVTRAVRPALPGFLVAPPAMLMPASCRARGGWRER